jgi:cell wall-associated NlpC family hydrolase
MNFKNRLCISLCLSIFFVSFAISSNAQTRSRVVATPESQPTNTQSLTDKLKRTIISSPTTNASQRPVLTNNITVVSPAKPLQPLVKTTGSTQPINSILASRLNYAPNLNQRLVSSIQSKIGIPYLYGSMGPNRYDCSSFVWKVFQEAGIVFTRTSARTFWNQFEPVYGDDRFKFGTLVFFNKLGHVGIVADENGFYQASSSKGITYSKFEGYWEKRIVGYRRIPNDYMNK